MSGRRDSLSPPEKTGTVDPGAHELESSDSDDHFSDAQSAPSRESQAASPIPKLRVEKISDEPSYGEVPGTDAYKMREGDAEPDEIAVIPDESDKASGESRSQSGTPSGGVIPTTVVEETADTEGSETHPEKHHRSDPPPDLVLKADGNLEMGKDASETPISPPLKSPSTGRTRRRSSIVPKSPGLASPTSRNVGLAAPGDEEEDEDFGDDFDDFEEGGEDDDFGDFDDGFEEPASAPAAAPAAPPPVQPLSIPIPDFEGLDADEILSVTEPYLNALYSTPDDDDSIPTLPPLPRDVNPVFLTPRSASLWSQLVAPPPLQPPDWIRSRIRRLFLVSLGVPVDLDEILPASKQKKLVLPSLAVPARRDSPRTSSDSRRSGVSRLKQAAANNGSSTSVDSQGKPREPSSSGGKGGKRRGPPPAPELDLVAGRQLCQTTDEALDGMTDAELGAHVARLEAMEGTAREVLEYWTKRTDEKIGDREAFEGVIENLVKHARKVRK